MIKREDTSDNSFGTTMLAVLLLFFALSFSNSSNNFHEGKFSHSVHYESETVFHSNQANGIISDFSLIPSPQKSNVVLCGKTYISLFSILNKISADSRTTNQKIALHQKINLSIKPIIICRIVIYPVPKDSGDPPFLS
jgi:hypothetical protein